MSIRILTLTIVDYKVKSERGEKGRCFWMTQY